MTPDQATALAARIIDRIAFSARLWPADLPPNPYHELDRRRVEADLAAILDWWEHGGVPVSWRNYAESNLRLTAATYGVTE